MIEFPTMSRRCVSDPFESEPDVAANNMQEEVDKLRPRDLQAQLDKKLAAQIDAQNEFGKFVDNHSHPIPLKAIQMRPQMICKMKLIKLERGIQTRGWMKSRVGLLSIQNGSGVIPTTSNPSMT